jgi:hypothetical protein
MRLLRRAFVMAMACFEAATKLQLKLPFDAATVKRCYRCATFTLFFISSRFRAVVSLVGSSS